MKHTIRRTVAATLALLTVILSVALLPLSVSAASDASHTSRETARDLTADPITERMEKNTDERWYKITVSGAGDAVIVIQSHMKTNDYTENWSVVLFAADGETEIGKFHVKGGTNTRSYALHPSEPATYYLRIRGVENAKLFDEGEYTVSVFTVLAGTAADDSRIHKGIQTVEKAGQVFLRLGDTYFIKRHDGEAKVALYQRADGTVVPILYGSREAVEFVVSTTGQVVKERNTGGVYGNGWSDSASIDAYTDEELSPEGLSLYYLDKSSYKNDQELRDAVMKRMEISEHGAVGWFLLHYWYWLVIAVVAGIILVICFIVKGDGHNPFRELYKDMIGNEY